MAEFSCAAAGATSCGWSSKEKEDEDAMIAEVAAHLEEKHDVQHVTATLAKYARAVARGEY